MSASRSMLGRQRPAARLGRQYHSPLECWTSDLRTFRISAARSDRIDEHGPGTCGDRVHATIHGQLLSIDETGLVAGKKQYGLSDIPGVPFNAKRGDLAPGLAHGIAHSPGADEGCHHVTRRNAVYSN